MKHLSLLQLCGLIFSVLLFSACGGSVPSESEARAIFEKKYTKGLPDGAVKILEFKKVNGLAGERDGIKFYNMEYEAELEYPNGVNPECAGEYKFSWHCFELQTAGILRKAKGEKEIIKNTLNFVKTENGWKAQ